MMKVAQSRWRSTKNLVPNWGIRIQFVFGALGLIILFAFTTNKISSIMGWHPQLQERERKECFTILINTWRRPDLLKKSVQHYAGCSNVDSIRIVWSESTDPPSDGLLAYLQSSVRAASHKRRSGHTVKLKIDMHDEDNLNTRFKPLEGLATDAIFSIDDDVVIDCKTLAFAFNVWCSARDSMVGFVPRMHWPRRDNRQTNDVRYLYGGWWSVWWTGTYSMVLSKCAFFHQKYLNMYSNHMPAEIRDFVTKERNCEDIAMSFLVANATGGPPVWVKGVLSEIGTSGISSLTGHNEHRTFCLNKFAEMYSRMPLVASNLKAQDARKLWFW